MKNVNRLFSGPAAALLAVTAFVAPAGAADIAVEPATEGRYVSEVRVSISDELAQVVVHACDGSRTVHSPEDLPDSSVFPVSVSGSHMAGITVMAGDSVRAVAFACPDAMNTRPVSSKNSRRSEGETIEGALF